MILSKMAQRSLFDAPYQHRSPTSREAAEAIRPQVPNLQVRVLEFIKANGPVTDSAIIDGLDLPANSARPRRIELMHAGVIRQGGTVIQANGRRAATWVIANDYYANEREG